MRAYNQLAESSEAFSRYSIFEKLGEGLSSAVYRAFDKQTQTEVVLKVLDPMMAQDKVGLERFRREAMILRQLNHPAIIKVYEIFSESGLHAISMEYSNSSQNLKSFLKTKGVLNPTAFLSLAAALLGALEFCHRRGVLHRDLKPQNILIDEFGHAKLVDFGISKINSMPDITRTGASIGTPEYMAPESFQDRVHGPQSDLYSLGILFYELLTGHPPHTGSSLAMIMRKHQTS